MDERDKYPSEAADRFQVRLPPGLRDRIKAYAERHGRSMNTEIVRILEREFPAPVSIQERIGDLTRTLGLLRQGRASEFFDRFSEDLFETLLEVTTGRIKVDEETRLQVQAALNDWQTTDQENANERYTGSMDEKEYLNFQQTGSTAKIVDRNGVFMTLGGKRLGNLSDDEFEAYRLGYDAGLAAKHEPTADASDPFEGDK